MTRKAKIPGDDFDRALERLFHPVRRYCERMLGDRHEGEDEAQQTFLQAYRAWDRFLGQATRKTWIFRIAADVCARALQVRRRLPDEISPLPDKAAGEDSDPTAKLENEEQRLAVEKTLQDICPAHRMVLVLFCLEELSHAEIAELRARFDATHRLNAQSMRKRFLGLLLGSFGIATLGALVGHVLAPFHPRAPESPDLANLWIVLYSAATIFSAYMLYRLRELERAPDLFDRLTRRERRLPRSFTDHIGYFPVIAVLVLLEAHRLGWLWAIIEVMTLWLVFALMAHLLRRRLRGQRMDTDPALWSWWYGEVDQGSS